MAELTRFSQQDPKWKTQQLGFDKESTLGDCGCLLTSMTMVASIYGFDVSPESLNAKLKDVEGFLGSMIIPSQISEALPGMKVSDYVDCSNQPAPLAEIDTLLGQGKPVIVEVNYSPKPGLQNHWIVLYAKKDSDYLIQDPWPYPAEIKGVTLTQRYGFIGKPAQIIIKVLFLEGASNVGKLPETRSDTSQAAGFKVYTAVEDLAIRSQPLSFGTNPINRMPINTELIILERDEIARAKIGQLNQWLAIQAPDGSTGYVAAWYVSLKRQATPAIPPVPAQPRITSTPIAIRTITDGVALRTKAETNEATLLKRLPLRAELMVLDPPEEAYRIIGAKYAWLRVKDITATEGLVAAWYVALVGHTALNVEKHPSQVTPFSEVMTEIPPMLLRTSQQNLALRSEPIIAPTTLIKRLTAYAELISIEPPDISAPKVGKLGEWIHVRDITGEEGYVAAWYVIKRPDDPSTDAGPPDS